MPKARSIFQSPSGLSSPFSGRGWRLRLWAVLALAVLGLTPIGVSPSAAQDSQAGDSQETQSRDSRPEASPASTAERVWIDVFDAKGRVPADLSPADFEVFEGGEPVTAASLLAAPAGSRSVLYFDQTLLRSSSLRRAAETLGEEVRRLAEIGEVEIVMADPSPEGMISSRDPFLLAERLSRTALTAPGRGRILEIRERILRELRLGSSPAARSTPQAAAQIVLQGIDEELTLIRQAQEELLVWAASEPADERARLLVLIEDGFDLDPIAFYTRHLEEVALRAVVQGTVERARAVDLEAAAQETARVLAALGWTVMPLALESTTDDLRPFGAAIRDSEDPQGVGGQTAAPTFTVRPGSIFRRNRGDDEAPEPELLAPLAPLRLLARASGGEVVTNASRLRDVVVRWGNRVGLEYRSPPLATDDLRQVEVRSRRPELSVVTRRWMSHGTPETISAARLRRLFLGQEGADLEVAALLRLGEEEGRGDLEVRLDLRRLEPEDLARLDQARLQVAYAVAVPGGEPYIRRELINGEDLSQRQEWLYRTSVDMPPGATQVAVTIAELNLDRWGGSLAAVSERSAAADGDGDGSWLPSPTVVEILPPEDEVLRGRVRFETAIYDSKIARVVFLLDERQAAQIDRPPFSARLDLGRTPRRQDLTVIAYDAEGRELGRDEVVLNGGRGGLEVELVSPSRRQGSGWVEAQAEVSVPVERQLDRVLFFWNNEAVSTLYAPPFRQRIYIPDDRPVGYIRAVAMLDDGSVAEDVLFMNGPESAGERVEVNLVELYTVVTDHNGRPVRDLERQDFTLFEEGVEQEIATFSAAEDLPITLGMAIDSSASMFVKLANVQRAASRFLESTLSEEDRAFVVDFDSQPRLAMSTTYDLQRILRAIDSLEASGRTALWESVVYSLVQLQGISGRKALIVFSDGADEDDQFPFRSCLQFARRMGVPIYLILMRKEPKGNEGLSLLTRSFSSRVDRLVEATGGRVFYAKEYRDLGEVYDEIEQELRSQYLLAYYPRGNDRQDQWRDVDVRVRGKGLEPRTLSGYWQ